MLDKPFYSDGYFWTIGSLGLLSYNCQNFYLQTRYYANLHKGVLRGLIVGYVAHLVAYNVRKRKVVLLEQEQFAWEATYMRRLAQRQGKYLEDNQDAIKEVFKTIVF